MTITPISITPRNLGAVTSFSGKRNNENEKTPQFSTKNIVAVPVAILIAMNPSMINAAKDFDYANKNLIEMSEVSQDTKPSKEYVKETFGQFFNQKTLEVNKIVNVTEKGFEGALLFMTSKDNNDVKKVYYVRQGDKYKFVTDMPPVIKEIYLHKTSDGNFYGINIEEKSLIDKNYLTGEIKIDTNAAEYILGVINSKTELENKTNIIQKNTNSKALIPVHHW